MKASTNKQLAKINVKENLPVIITTLCAEGWMRTSRFEPTPAWERALSNPSDDAHLLLVAAAGAAPVGWCRVFPTTTPGEAELGIGLLAPYRNQGVGTRLVQQAVTWAQQRGFSRLTLATRADNSRAIRVFEKCGFAFTGQREEIWLEMARPLATGEFCNDD